MFNIGEYNRPVGRLSDYLPWAALVGPGLVVNKDGSFQKTLRFRGPDLGSASDAELMISRGRLNEALRRLGSRWCIHVEARRQPTDEYPRSVFPDPVSQMVDDERRRSFTAAQAYFETAHFLTLTYLPPGDLLQKTGAMMIANARGGLGTNYEVEAETFLAEFRALQSALDGVMQETGELTDDETLTFLHRCVSTRHHDVSRPEIPGFLDALLTDDDLCGGLSPRLGNLHLRTISVRAYPSATFPGLLDRLNTLGLSYRWVSRFLPLDKDDARRTLTTVRKRWFAKRKGVLGLFREAITQEGAELLDPDALTKTRDADAALAILGGDAVSIGYFTPTVTVFDESLERVDAMCRRVTSTLNAAGLIAKVEDVNAVEAWLGSLPGHAYADCRRPLIGSLNLCDMLPLSATWPGPAVNLHLTAALNQRGHAGVQPVLIYARTAGTTPFRLDLHQGDVGHTMVIGPTGSGKSVLLNVLALQWLRYPGAQVFIFDKGKSTRATTLLVGGDHFALQTGGGDLSLQPLARADDPIEAAWAFEWLEDLLKLAGHSLTASDREELWVALQSVASAPAVQRTLTLLQAVVQDAGMKTALRQFTVDGPVGGLLDGDDDRMGAARWQSFEIGDLLQSRAAASLALTCIFRRLEQKFDGSPTLLILDEAWALLDNTVFSAKLREWLKTLRKRNVSVVFATQSLADVTESSIAITIAESCPTRIFLGNPQARTETTAPLYRGLGLSDQQIRTVSEAVPKRQYYYSSPAGDRVFELSLGRIGLLAAGRTSEIDQLIIDKALAACAQDGFPAAFFALAGGEQNSAHGVHGVARTPTPQFSI